MCIPLYAAVSWETAVSGSTRHLADPFEP